MGGGLSLQSRRSRKRTIFMSEIPRVIAEIFLTSLDSIFRGKCAYCRQVTRRQHDPKSSTRTRARRKSGRATARTSCIIAGMLSVQFCASNFRLF